jgi:hypothetical protein
MDHSGTGIDQYVFRWLLSSIGQIVTKYCENMISSLAIGPFHEQILFFV